MAIGVRVTRGGHAETIRLRPEVLASPSTAMTYRATAALPCIDRDACRTSGPLLRTRTRTGTGRRAAHRDACRTARVADITRPIGPHALRRTVGTVGFNQGIPLRDIQHLLRRRMFARMTATQKSTVPASGRLPRSVVSR